MRQCQHCALTGSNCTLNVFKSFDLESVVNLSARKSGEPEGFKVVAGVTLERFLCGLA
jgi:hypothetical protein